MPAWPTSRLTSRLLMPHDRWYRSLWVSPRLNGASLLRLSIIRTRILSHHLSDAQEECLTARFARRESGPLGRGRLRCWEGERTKTRTCPPQLQSRARASSWIQAAVALSPSKRHTQEHPRSYPLRLARGTPYSYPRARLSP